MQVVAFKTRTELAWRWRIVNYAGETIAESREEFATIGAAVATGARRLVAMNVVDDPKPVSWRRSTSYLRHR
jgi:hypothetical protein